MKKRVVKSKMIRSDCLQVDCDACGEGGLVSLSDSYGYGNGVNVGDDMICENCEQVFNWGNYVGVKMTLIRGK